MSPQSQPSSGYTYDLVLCPDLGWVVSLTQDRVPDVSTVLLTDLSLLPQEPRLYGSLGLLPPRSCLQLSLGHLPPYPSRSSSWVTWPGLPTSQRPLRHLDK